VRVALVAAALGVAFDLLFFAAHELPTTVPVAAALAIDQVQLRRASRAARERTRPGAARGPSSPGPPRRT
jgi:hypothetical protein